MSSRKEEILAKRAKLDALKRQREAQQLRFSTSRSTLSPDEMPSQSTSRVPSRIEDRRSEVNSLVESLIGESRPSSTPGFKSSRPNSVMSASEASISELASPQTESHGHNSMSIYTQTLSTITPMLVYEAPPSPVREVLTYSKEVQTTEVWVSSGAGPDENDGPMGIRQNEDDEVLRNRIRELEEEISLILLNESKTNAEDPEEVNNRITIRDMTEEERDKVTTTDEFADFIERSTKVIERALDQDYDILADYGIGLDGDEDEQAGRRLKEVCQFYSERWSKKRMVSDLDFSPKFPELVLASYTKNPSAPNDPDGLVQVWNMHLHDRPEYIFHAQSDVLTARFSPFHPNLIIGGAYSGQVLIWDTRAKSLPVLKTPLTGSGHTHPVYSVSIVGTQHANNIISCSTDGWVCGWTTDMLAQPTNSLELICPPPSKSDDVAPTCMAFPSSDPTYFLVGTEEGSIYPVHRWDRAGAKAGVEPRIAYRGHGAPIMSLDFHPVRGPVDLGDLVLSSSLDWSVKMWKVRPPAANSTAAIPGVAPTIATPLMEFTREDVVYDAKWSPVRPGVFGLVDGAGALEIWDVTVDTEVPLAKATPKSRQGALSLSNRSLNKMAWERNDGRKVAVGGLDGVVTVFDVGNELGGADMARGEEWSGVKRLVQGRVEAQAAAAAAASGGQVANGVGTRSL